jgi:hypothetical protein
MDAPAADGGDSPGAIKIMEAKPVCLQLENQSLSVGHWQIFLRGRGSLISNRQPTTELTLPTVEIPASGHIPDRSPNARHRCATLPGPVQTSKRQIVPITASSYTHQTRSAPFKIHSLPCGRLPSSRCIRSALPKRIRTRTVACGRSRYSTKTYRYLSGLDEWRLGNKEVSTGEIRPASHR